MLGADDRDAPPARDRLSIARQLREIAALLRAKEEPSFRVLAYERGARALEDFGGDLDELVRAGRLKELRGVGSGLEGVITELHRTGSSRTLEKLRSDLPPGAPELARAGLSLARIRALHEALGIRSRKELMEACREGRVRAVKGFGEKTEKRLLEKLEAGQDPAGGMLLGRALPIVERMLEHLKQHSGTTLAAIAGALRRGEELVDRADIVVGSDSAEALRKHVLRYPSIVEAREDSAASLVLALAEGLMVNVHLVPPARFGVALVGATGPEEHLRRLAQRARDRAVALDALATTSRSTPPDGPVYEALGLPWIPPELRDDPAAFTAAERGDTFADLVTIEDITAMVHCHSTHSDGKNSILEMARAAKALGMEAITITDHSPTAHYAGGVTIDRLRDQWHEIEAASREARIRILKGTESDILPDGALDYPDEVLAELDIIIASIHNRHRMESAAMTQRITAAMRHPLFKIWGHAQGRLLKSRPPFDCDMPEILDTIARSPAAVEINGDYHRLDLAPPWIREAKKRGIPFVISTDAHSIEDLENLRFGVLMARRGGVRRQDVLNARSVSEFARAVKPGRNPA